VHMQMSALLTKMALFVIVILIGMVGARKQILTKDFNRGLSWLIVNIFIVAAIINSVVSMDASELTMGELGMILLISSVTYVVLYLLGALTVRLLRVDEGKAPQLELLMSAINNLFVTLPVVETVYGSKGAFIIALGCIPFNLLLFTYGIARLRGKGGKFHLRDILSTPLIATLAAVLLFALRIPVPTPVRSFLSSLAAATVPMSMLLVGSSLGNVDLRKALRDRSMLLLTAERFILAPLVVFLLMKLICSDEVLAGAMVLTAATPSAILVTALSLQAGRSGEYSSEGITVTTLLSMITIPLTVYLLL
ncbi:MAG: AEC family transporter, partial [Oscillospiraceae bacterium]|nr:AEC family transporter [Oscillospiraceae bacterium]